MSNAGKDKSRGSSDRAQQKGSSSAASQLRCLGSAQNEIPVGGTSSSSVTTSVTQAGEASCKQSAKAVNPRAAFLERKAPVKRPPQTHQDVVPAMKRSNVAQTIHLHSPVSRRPYKDRVVHLLALRSYKKPELLARLERDGVYKKDRGTLGVILNQVARLNLKENTYSLKDFLFQSVQKDWPGYSETEKQSLELILSRKLNASQNGSSTGLQPPETPHGHVPPTSEGLRQYCCLLDSGVKETCAAPEDDASPPSERADYFLKYVAITSCEQRESYINDFNVEYNEYQTLHAQIESVTRRFKELRDQWNLLSPGSKESQELHKNILEEYQKIRESSPSYHQVKRRCEYLHGKLAHIKGLLEDFDQQR